MRRVSMAAILLAGASLASAAQETSLSQTRERTRFNSGWRFTRGDPKDAPGTLGYEHLRPWILATGTDLVGAAARRSTRPAGDPGGDVSYVRADFDDSGWRSLTLPHDWGIEGPFDQALPGETGKLPWVGIGWYRKRFMLPASDAGRRIALDVDGAMAYSAIWLNGRLVGGWPYGYSSFRVDLTPYVKLGAENVLAIRLDNPPNSSRWYPGSGLYRNVWLVKTGAVHVAHWGVFVTTPIATPEAATVNVDVAIVNETKEKTALTLTTRVYELGASDARGADPVATSEPIKLEIDPARATSALRSNLLRVPRPRLWSIEHPERYVAVSTIESDGRILDSYETTFGIRTIVFESERGFLLNGERVPLRGVCMHHDLGALGAAVSRRAVERQLEILKEMGVNSIRTSHNPPAPELLDLADRMGFVIMDEAFDCWRRGKKLSPGSRQDDPAPKYDDYARVFDDWHERDLRAQVRRDRNHPSVVMWSIGNEVLEQFYSDGWELAAHLAGIVREEDRSRAVASGLNNAQSGYIGFQTAIDLVGFNYKPQEYASFHRRAPWQPVFGAETSSCVSTRGEYFFPVSDDKADGRADFQVSSYDLYAPRWALPPDVEFKGLDEAPYALGEHVWTGFDYLGEPTPYNADVTNLLNFSDPAEKALMEKQLKELGRIAVPSRSSYFGIVDLAGFKKDRFYIYQARWRPELPMVHILPHWNWPERVGQVTPVHVYSAGDEAELFLNGKSLGRKSRGPLEYRFRWDDVVYEPGELRVVAYKSGARWAEAVQQTTGPAAKLGLAADRAQLKADGEDLAFVAVSVQDRAERTVPRSHPDLRFSIEGAGTIVATDNGDPTSHVPFQSLERQAFGGLALAIVRTKAGAPGPIVVRVESKGLASAEVKLVSLRAE